MARLRILELAAWSVACVAIIGAFRLWVPPEVEAPAFDAPSTAPVNIPDPVDPGALQLSATILRDRNPFRFDRSATQLRFGAEATTERSATEPEPEAEDASTTAPHLSLGGLIGGAPWGAIVEGAPGWERGLLLFVGEEREGFRLDAIRGDTAVLSSEGFTWTLTSRSSWRR